LNPMLWTEYDAVLLVDADFVFMKPFDSVFKTPHSLSVSGADVIVRGERMVSVNGGLFVYRPKMSASKKHYDFLVELIRSGNFTKSGGWNGYRRSSVYGGRTIQGIMPYYIARELNFTGYGFLESCMHNMYTVMCRKRHEVHDIVMNQFAGMCMKPWGCDFKYDSACEYLSRRWWSLYAELFTANSLHNPDGVKCPNGKHVSLSKVLLERRFGGEKSSS
jgi:hypothetical protein